MSKQTYESKIEELRVFNLYIQQSDTNVEFKSETPSHIRKRFARMLTTMRRNLQCWQPK